jgi:hypothetical protein
MKKLISEELIVSLLSVDGNLRLCFTTESTEITEFYLFYFKFSVRSACSVVKFS